MTTPSPLYTTVTEGGGYRVYIENILSGPPKTTELGDYVNGGSLTATGNSTHRPFSTSNSTSSNAGSRFGESLLISRF